MINSRQAQKQHEKLKSCWSDESKLTQKILIAILAHLEARPMRKPTAYAKFFGKKMKGGYSAREIAKLWRRQK